MIEITEATFEKEVTQEKSLVLVDFWAPWCGPCRALGPVLEEVSKELDGKVKIKKVNIDENNELGVKFSIMSIPTMILFKDGKVVDQKVGGLPKAKLAEWINSNL